MTTGGSSSSSNRSTGGKTRILLVDDHAVVRFGIAQLIQREPDLTVCGEEEDAAKALAAIQRLKPDLVLADISLKDSSGLELMRNVRVEFPKLRVLVVSAHDEMVYAEVAFRAGALGYLMKADALENVITAIRRVLSGNIYVSEKLAARMVEQRVHGSAGLAQDPVQELSDRELEVYQLIGKWKKTSEIAKELHLSVKTVEYYRDQIKHKLNLKNGAELAQHATQWVQQGNPT